MINKKKNSNIEKQTKLKTARLYPPQNLLELNIPGYIQVQICSKISESGLILFDIYHIYSTQNAFQKHKQLYEQLYHLN